MKTISSIKNGLRIQGILFLSMLGAGSASAQTFTPPTVLPAENVNLGGSGSYCIGLADMIRTGNIHLWNIPCFIKYFTQTLIALGGSLSVLYVMIGGYTYIVMGEEKKSEAKSTITHALIGLAVTLMAWILVDLALRFVTE